MRNSETS
jgi:hypothetical protein